jgi:hypothetical protein
VRAATFLTALCAVGCDAPPPAATPPPAVIDGIPVIPVGYDAYRQLDALPLVHLLDRAYMRSTYDRTGGNEAADASHYLRQEVDGTYTTIDVAGTGLLVFARANHWHGSPWHDVVDGADFALTETATADPDVPVADSTFSPAEALSSPLALTWSTTAGADVYWVPVPFERSLRLADGRTCYGTGYYIYHLYPHGADHLSTPIAAWQEDAPPADVTALLANAGSDIAPAGDDHATDVDIPATGAVDALALSGHATIRRLAIDAPVADAATLANAHLVITWDDRAVPSVDAPIGLLFAGGSLYDRNHRGTLVTSLLASVTLDSDQVHLALYLPMPFASSARVSLVGAGTAVAGVHVAARTVADDAPPGVEGYFHASFVDHGVPTPGQDLVLLDTTATEGGGDWCGSFVGTSLTFSDAAVLTTLEGDPRFFFDDATSPQGYGTGTEEWGAGGDYWGGSETTLALAGHPTGAPSAAAAQNATDEVESEYRFLVADAMPFGRNARIQLEHGGVDDSTEHYRTVTYWYGRPRACLTLTDTLHVGDPTDEAAHGYAAPGATPPVTITSQWDGLGVDAEDAVDTDVARTSVTTSTFTVAIDPQNHGLLLRRKLDYAIADQRAEVWVADADSDAPFVFAGVWYLAGSTTSVFSDPSGELDPGSNSIRTVDRRWREDEFLVPRALTESRAAIRLQIRVTAQPLPVVPGPSTGTAGWSESTYSVYSYVL